MVEYLNRICCKFTTESVSKKKFENRLIFGEVMGKSLVSCFLTHSVYMLPCWWSPSGSVKHGIAFIKYKL